MIHLILGRQGSGKTLFLVHKALEHFKRGHTVYANFKLNIPFHELDYNDIIECKYSNGAVLLDEIHQLLPARRALRKINVKICDSFLSMARKQNLDIYGTTQLPRKVDVRFREEADFMYWCEKFAFIDDKWVQVMSHRSLPMSTPIMIKLDITEAITGNEVTYNIYGNQYFNMFDTKEVIHVKGLEGIK